MALTTSNLHGFSLAYAGIYIKSDHCYFHPIIVDLLLWTSLLWLLYICIRAASTTQFLSATVRAVLMALKSYSSTSYCKMVGDHFSLVVLVACRVIWDKLSQCGVLNVAGVTNCCITSRSWMVKFVMIIVAIPLPPDICIWNLIYMMQESAYDFSFDTEYC